MDKQEFITWVKKLQERYRPNDAVKSRLASIDFVALVGPTGVGKTAIIRASQIPSIIGDTTRQPRPEEKNGRDYFFRDDYLKILQEVKDGEYVEFIINTNNEFYGTRLDTYPPNGSCIAAILANVVPKLRTFGFHQVLPMYILPPSYVEWMRRIGGVRAQDLDYRLEEARHSLPQALDDQMYHFILNDNVESALRDMHLILAGQPINEHRKALARQTAELLIGRLGDPTQLLRTA